MDFLAKSKPQQFGYISGFITAINITCLFLPYWMHIDGDRSIGTFNTHINGSEILYKTKCSRETMSETVCQYLFSMQTSAVITVLFGVFSTILYFLPPKSMTALPIFLALSGTLLQFIFSLITLVLFIYFKNDYYDDDGVNREYPSPDADSIKFDFGFYLWMTAFALSFLTSVFGYYSIQASGYGKKGSLSMV